MAEQDSLGPLGPNILSIEAVSDLVYSVEGHNFQSGFRAAVQDGTGQAIADASTSKADGTRFTLTLPYVTPGPYTLVVTNPDGRTSSQQFNTPGTDASNSVLRADS